MLADHIALSIAADGSLFWNGESVDRKDLRERALAPADADEVPVSMSLSAQLFTRWVSDPGYRRGACGRRGLLLSRTGEAVEVGAQNRPDAGGGNE